MGSLSRPASGMAVEVTVGPLPDPSRTDVVAPVGAWAGAVLLHPHPSYGGDRFNAVVDALWRALPGAGVAAVRFDFTSEAVDAGVADALAALELLPAQVPLAMVGYSFGAVVASKVADDRLVGWALVAPPFGRMLPGSDADVGADERPKLVLSPVHDQFCPPASARTETASWRAVTLEDVPSADHFLVGATARVADRVLAFLRSLSDRRP